MKRLIHYSIAIVTIAITFSSCQKEPEACFTPSSSSVETGTSVAFLNCTDDGDSYLWNFGDNSSSNLETPSHVYNSPGTYLVSLTAFSKNEKKKNNITKTIIVTSPTPQPPSSNSLSYNTYFNGSLLFSTDTLWYSFNVTNGVTYYLQWDDSYEGSGLYTADIIVNVFKANLTTTYISGGDSGYTFQPSFTATETGTVYVRVTPYDGLSASTGTFALRYY
jgi:PKD repeat protein